MRPLDRTALVLCAACSLAACTEVVDSAVEGRYAQYNYSTDWAKNEAILLNIVRASEFQPLNFMSFQPYQGTASVTGAASSPAFVIGPARANSQKQYTFGQGSLTASASGTGTVTVTSLDTSDFYDSLLSPVDYVNLNAFQRQGYPRELLFRLFADYVSLRPIHGDIHRSFVVYNEEPEEKRCASASNTSVPICFDDLVKFALLSGLSSEVRVLTPPSSGDNSKSAAAAAPSTKSGGNTGNTTSNPPKQQTEGRLCFDPALSNRAIYEYEHEIGPVPEGVKTAEYHPICGGTGPQDVWPTTTNQNAPNKQKKTGAAPSTAGTKPSPGIELLTVKVRAHTGWLVWDIHMYEQNSVEIGTRSTFAIYNFLGGLLRDPSSPSNQLTGPAVEDEDRNILTVIKGQPTGCFATAVLQLGVYCVPLDGAANTKRAFSILSQLLALKTTTDDLQLLPTIRLLPTD